MSISIGLTDLRHRHTQICAFRENNCRVVSRILTILQYQLGQTVDISGHLWNEQTIRPGNDGGLKGGKTGIASEHAKQDRLTMRLRRRADTVDKLGGTADGGLEADTVVGARHVIIHRFGNAPDGYALRSQHRAITERVIAANNDQAIQLQEVEIRDYHVSQVDALVGRVALAERNQMRGQVAHAHLRGISARGLEYRATLAINSPCIQAVQRHEIVALPG